MKESRPFDPSIRPRPPVKNLKAAVPPLMDVRWSVGNTKTRMLFECRRGALGPRGRNRL